MLNRLLTGLALTVSQLFGALRALAGDDAAAALIARKDLFGNPVKAGAAISPDSKWISWLAPRVYMLSSRERETSALYRVNVASGETTNATLMITPPNVRPFPSIVLARQERSCEPGG
jgi:hypothetical protein